MRLCFGAWPFLLVSCTSEEKDIVCLRELFKSKLPANIDELASVIGRMIEAMVYHLEGILCLFS